jgi:hypothetical protein
MERQGSTHRQPIDVRVIGARTRSWGRWLPRSSFAWTFSSDFVRAHVSRMIKTIQWISCSALTALERHESPGNKRDFRM